MRLESLNGHHVSSPNAAYFAGFFKCSVIFIILCLPLLTWLGSIGDIKNYFYHALPPGQIFYILAKLTGLYAILMLWYQMMYGLLKDDAKAQWLLLDWSEQRHRFIGQSILVVALLHFVLFLTAVTIRTQVFAYKLLVPNVSGGFYALAVSLGWFALAGLVIVALAAGLRKRFNRIWIWVHRCSPVVMLLAFFHALLIGSEAKSGLWSYLLLVCAITVLVAFIRRIRLTDVPYIGQANHK